MDADHILKCHGFCQVDRERMLADCELVERLTELPDDYRAEMVQAVLDNLYCLPPKEPAAE